MEENPLLRLIKKGKVVFTSDGKIIGFNEYTIFLPARVLNRLFVLLKERWGRNEAEEILKELGKFQAKQAFQRYVKTLGWEYLPKEKIWEFITQVNISLGLGKCEFRRLNDGYVCSIPKTPFAEEFLMEYGKQNHPVDFYFAGILESGLGAIVGKLMVCEEVKCYAKGDDCCEFIVKPKEETEEKETK
ncbi:MAG: V4R domain-containing protein [Candidatus Aenigmatarchaeota archaeon]